MSSNLRHAVIALGLLGTALLAQYCHRSGRDPGLRSAAPRQAPVTRTGALLTPRAALRPVALRETCTTQGEIRERDSAEARVESPGLRLYVPGSSGVEAALRFRYLGPTEGTALLGSGERREQLGLRLLGQDTCNALYVMWRLEPVPRLVVSLKRNPGQTRHAECKNQGYTTLRAERTRWLDAIERGSVHELRARLRGSRLEVSIDGVVAWEGAIDTRELPASGTAGLRSDNVRFDLLSLSAEMRPERRPGGASEIASEVIGGSAERGSAAGGRSARCSGPWVEESDVPATP